MEIAERRVGKLLEERLSVESTPEDKEVWGKEQEYGSQASWFPPEWPVLMPPRFAQVSVHIQ